MFIIRHFKNTKDIWITIRNFKCTHDTNYLKVKENILEKLIHRKVIFTKLSWKPNPFFLSIFSKQANCYKVKCKRLTNKFSKCSIICFFIRWSSFIFLVIGKGRWRRNGILPYRASYPGFATKLTKSSSLCKIFCSFPFLPKLRPIVCQNIITYL